MCNGVNFDAAGSCCSSSMDNINKHEDVSKDGIA
jgi:hypothetical protein